MKRKGQYRVEEIYDNCFWRIRTPEGKWMHHADGILPNSFTDKGAAERICQDLNTKRDAEMAL